MQNKYRIKKENIDFFEIESNYPKGTRTKKVVIDNNNRKAFFKYEGVGYNTSESCSEKMSYEIAKVLEYPCAKIELARDENGTLGILNYIFVDQKTATHIDAVVYLKENILPRSEFYTLSNIKNKLDELDKKLFPSFIRIMIFDALIGEQDRHEENWGIEKTSKGYSISPLYDNGCSLLKEFKNATLADKYYRKIKDFDAYIKKSKTYIYKENHLDKYKHFELIEYLRKEYPQIVIKELKKLSKLTDKKIIKIVNKMPDELLTNMHQKLIIEYLKKRRDFLIKLI